MWKTPLALCYSWLLATKNFHTVAILNRMIFFFTKTNQDVFKRRKYAFVASVSVHSTRNTHTVYFPTRRLFILPSLYLHDSSGAVPPFSAHRELICRNVCAALCDHSVNTPIILSASASRYHPAVEMTPEGLTVQFSRNGWQLSRQRRREQPASC